MTKFTERTTTYSTLVGLLNANKFDVGEEVWLLFLSAAAIDNASTILIKSYLHAPPDFSVFTNFCMKNNIKS